MVNLLLARGEEGTDRTESRRFFSSNFRLRSLKPGFGSRITRIQGAPYPQEASRTGHRPFQGIQVTDNPKRDSVMDNPNTQAMVTDNPIATNLLPLRHPQQDLCAYDRADRTG